MNVFLHLSNILYCVLANLIMTSLEEWIFFVDWRCKWVIRFWEISARITFRNRILFVRLNILMRSKVKSSLANTLGSKGRSGTQYILVLKHTIGGNFFRQVTRRLRNICTIFGERRLWGNRPLNEWGRSDEWLCNVGCLGRSEYSLVNLSLLGWIHLFIVIAVIELS